MLRNPNWRRVVSILFVVGHREHGFASVYSISKKPIGANFWRNGLVENGFCTIAKVLPKPADYSQTHYWSSIWNEKRPSHAGSLMNSAIARGRRLFIPNRIATESITGMSWVETGGRLVKHARYYSQYPVGARPTGGAIEGIHSYETGFSSRRSCFLGGLARSETLRFLQSGMTAVGARSLVAELCSAPATTNGAYGTMLGARRAWHVHSGELWPAHCITPRNLAHGPTASRYWWAMTLATWCR